MKAQTKPRKRKKKRMNNLLEEPLNPKAKTERPEEEEEVGLQAVRLANAVAFPMVLKATLELGVIDAISTADGAFLSPSEIVRRLPTKPGNPEAPMLLDRMLRLLASYSILKCRTVRTVENGAREVGRVYGPEPICRFLLNDNQDLSSFAPFFKLSHDDVCIKTWTRLKDVIVEGGDAFRHAHGMRLFEYTATDERFNKLFNQTMSECTTMIMKKVLEVYRGFEGVNVLVDVGGGVGTNLGLITSKYPQIKGINFDVACVLADAPSVPGVEHVAGDMFIDIPKGDAIFLKWILHDWTDGKCLKILKNCWKALPEKGKIIIVETILPVEPQNGDVYSNVAFDMDMTMLSICSGGRERTQIELQALAVDSGFSRCEFIFRAYHCWVIEFHKDTYA